MSRESNPLIPKAKSSWFSWQGIKESLSFKWSHIKEVIKVGLPFTATSAVTAIANMSITLILAHLGLSEFAASGLITAGLVIIQGFLFSPLYSVGVLAARAHNEGDKTALTMINQQGLLQGLLYAIPYTLSCAFMGFAFSKMGQADAVVNVVKDFFYGYALGGWADVLLTSTQQYGTAVKRQNAVLVISIIQKAITVVGGILLTHGLYGSPMLEGFGLGLAFSASSILALVGTNAYLIAKGEFSFKSLFQIDNFKQRFEHFKSIAKVGAPISLHVGCELASLSALLSFSGLINEIELASSQVAIQYTGLIAVPIIGLSQAVGILVSGAVAGKDIEKTRGYANSGFAIGLTFAALSTIGMVALTYPLTSVFVAESAMDADKIFELTQYLLYINAASIIPELLRNNSIGALRGLLDTHVPMYVNAGLSFLNIAAAFGAYKLGFGSYGIFASRTLLVGAIAAIVTKRWGSKISSLTFDAPLLENVVVDRMQDDAEASLEFQFEPTAHFVNQADITERLGSIQSSDVLIDILEDNTVEQGAEEQTRIPVDLEVIQFEQLEQPAMPVSIESLRDLGSDPKPSGF